MSDRLEPAAPPTGIRVVLCADDYGLSPGIGVAVRDLLDRGRLSATSCMTAGPHWPAEAARLRPYAGRADLGLHLTLTDQAPAGPCPRLAPDGRLPPLPALVTASLFARLPLDEIAAEAERQVDRFEAAMGRPPDHIDGHQHVHGLPGIRDVVVDLARRRLAPGGYVRTTDAPLAWLAGAPSAARAAVVMALGHGLTARLDRAGIGHNDRFAGVRAFTETAPYLDLIDQALTAGGRDLLVMCHPAAADSVLGRLDPVTAPRQAEYRTLKSPAFADRLMARGLRIGRFRPSATEAGSRPRAP